MLYATDPHGEKVTAQPKQKAICPFCKTPVISKCGKIKIWHWAHQSNHECDSWGECETAWHLTWKTLFPPECVEVSMGRHRADILTKSGVVIELQHSSLTADMIQEREGFYGERMLWLVNGERFAKNFVISHNTQFHAPTGAYIWHWERKSWQYSHRPVFLDFGEQGTLAKNFDYLDRTQFQENLRWTYDKRLYWVKDFQNRIGQFVEREYFIAKYAANSKSN